jgi:signal transduction histidine kinase
MSKPFNVIHHFKHTHDGSGPGWYAISGIPTYDSKGERIGYFGISRNITDLMDAQQKLKEETKRAENSGKMKSAFLANMTHEIRTPLNAIVGFSDLLQMMTTTEEKRELIHVIHNNCDMLLRLINDIMAISAMDANGLTMNPIDTDFAEAFNEMCQTLAQRVENPNVQFIKENPYQTLQTHLDVGRMTQVMTNFVTNAVKYTQNGHIKVGYRLQDSGIYMYCEDTGTGIPKEQCAKVFERFVKLNDYVQGTGLGLSICKAIAERCNGKIGVDSEVGQGSTFWIWIPCVIDQIEAIGE